MTASHTHSQFHFDPQDQGNMTYDHQREENPLGILGDQQVFYWEKPSTQHVF